MQIPIIPGKMISIWRLKEPEREIWWALFHHVLFDIRRDWKKKTNVLNWNHSILAALRQFGRILARMATSSYCSMSSNHGPEKMNVQQCEWFYPKLYCWDDPNGNMTLYKTNQKIPNSLIFWLGPPCKRKKAFPWHQRAMSKKWWRICTMRCFWHPKYWNSLGCPSPILAKIFSSMALQWYRFVLALLRSWC